MIFVEVIYNCDAARCTEHRVVPMDTYPGSDREQYVRIPSELPTDWRLDNSGNTYCPSHGPAEGAT